jgi:NADH-ubiquinone oxidoreductase chain 2
MAGTPPLLGFFSKQFVLYSAIESGYYFMAVSGILVSIISASFYLRIIRILHTETVLNNNNSLIIEPTVEISNIHSLLISSLTILILFFVLKPSILLKSTQLLSLTLHYY